MTGQQLKIDGLDRVEENNEAWMDRIRYVAWLYCMERGTVSTDDLREYATNIGWQPTHPNAWGAIFRGKHWRCVGRKKSRLASNHAREIRIWRWVDGKADIVFKKKD